MDLGVTPPTRRVAGGHLGPDAPLLGPTWRRVARANAHGASEPRLRALAPTVTGRPAWLLEARRGSADSMLTSSKTERLRQAPPRSLQQRRSTSAHERRLFRARLGRQKPNPDERRPVIGPGNERQVLQRAAAPPDRQRRYFGRPPTGSRIETDSLSEARALREARGRCLPNTLGAPETSPRYLPNPRGVPKAQGRYFLQPSVVQKVSTSGFSDLGQSHEARCGCFGQLP